MGLLQVYGAMFQMMWTIAQRAVESSPSIAYEPLLIEHGVKLVRARGLASLTIRRGTQHANESIRLPAIVGAIRFLAKPGRDRRAILSKAEVLLAAWEETSIIDTIFDDAKLRESEFIGLLKSAVEGREVAGGALRKLPPSSRPFYRFREGRRLAQHQRRMSFCLKSLFLKRVRRATRGILTKETTEIFPTCQRRNKSRPAARRKTRPVWGWA